VPQRSGIAVEFRADRTVVVSGCHLSVGRWTAADRALAIDDLTLGARWPDPVDGVEACPGPTAEAEEAGVLDALRRAAAYRLVPTYQFDTWYPVAVEHLVVDDAEGRPVLTGGVYTR
jgi:hypothetical protein